MNARHPSATTVRELWKTKIYYLEILNGPQYTKAHTVRGPVKECTPGALSLLMSRMGCLGFHRLALYW